jgi:hypothetical protein
VVLVHPDGARASRQFLAHLDTLGVQFTVSYLVPAGKAYMVEWINDKEYWQPALDVDGEECTAANRSTTINEIHRSPTESARLGCYGSS